MALRELLHHKEIEVRYGAFRALSIASPGDAEVMTKKLDTGFAVHQISSSGEPVIHVSRRRNAEVVFFGTNQKFSAPLFMRAGHDVLIQCPENGDKVKLKMIAPGQPTRELYSSMRVTDVIQAAAELGVEYPAIVEMLEQAQKQRNLDGMLAFDQIPQGGRMFQRPEDAEGPATEMVGSSGMLPNLFDFDPSGMEIETEPAPEPEKKAASATDDVEPESMGGVGFGVK